MSVVGNRLRELAETATRENIDEHLAEASRLAEQADPEEKFWIQTLMTLAESYELTQD